MSSLKDGPLGATPFIAIIGNIGSGKTTIAKHVSEIFGVPSYHEMNAVNEVLLSEFYRDPKQFAFELQFSLMSRRVRQYRAITASGKGGVIDRSLAEDQAFVSALCKSGMLTDSQQKTYMETYQEMISTLRYPDLYIYLDRPPSLCLENIKERNRPYEKGITLEYLEGIRTEYEYLIKEGLRPTPVIVIPWDKYQTAFTVVAIVDKELRKYTHIHRPMVDDSSYQIRSKKMCGTCLTLGLHECPYCKKPWDKSDCTNCRAIAPNKCPFCLESHHVTTLVHRK